MTDRVDAEVREIVFAAATLESRITSALRSREEERDAMQRRAEAAESDWQASEATVARLRGVIARVRGIAEVNELLEMDERDGHAGEVAFVHAMDCPSFCEYACNAFGNPLADLFNDAALATPEPPR
jgi:hypothetical protein